jgi:Tfp pilus assembly protein PilX
MDAAPQSRSLSVAIVTRRLRSDERGIALAMVMMVIVALSISAAAVSQLITSNQVAYGRDRQEERAFNAAEAGLNYAIAQLSQINSASYGAGSIINPSWATVTLGDTTTAQWTAQKSGTPLGPNTYWRVWSKATVGKVTRMVKVDVAAPQTPVVTPSSAAWGYGVFVAGDLCLSGTQQIQEPSSSGATEIEVYVGGNLKMSGSAQIGASSRRIKHATIVGACYNSNKLAACSNAAKSSVYATMPVEVGYSAGALTLTKPPIYPDDRYAEGDWRHPVCSVGSFTFENDSHRNTSLGTVDVLTGSAYDCTVYSDGSHSTEVGRMSWNPATHQFTLSGMIYIDGNLEFNGGDQAQYGHQFGALYVNGTVRTNGNSALCGPGSTLAGDHCDQIWDASLGAISLMTVNADNASIAWDMSGTAEYNLLVYVVGYFKENGTARVTGPVIADQALVSGTADQTDVLNPPPSTPGAQGSYQNSTWGSVKPSTWSRLPAA